MNGVSPGFVIAVDPPHTELATEHPRVSHADQLRLRVGRGDILRRARSHAFRQGVQPASLASWAILAVKVLKGAFQLAGSEASVLQLLHSAPDSPPGAFLRAPDLRIHLLPPNGQGIGHSIQPDQLLH